MSDITVDMTLRDRAEWAAVCDQIEKEQQEDEEWEFHQSMWRELIYQILDIEEAPDPRREVYSSQMCARGEIEGIKLQVRRGWREAHDNPSKYTLEAMGKSSWKRIKSMGDLGRVLKELEDS